MQVQNPKDKGQNFNNNKYSIFIIRSLIEITVY